MGFDVKEYFPGVYHIGDAMGVCMTLLAGRRQAVLVDAGYGLESAGAAVTSLTDLLCRLILTHGHHDHALGAMGFDRVWMRPEDLGVYRTYTAPAQRKLVLESARAKGFAVDEAAYLGAGMPEPQPIEERLIDLGGLTLQPVHCPGHTPGSLVLYVPEYRLLLTGDDWNPTTWLFFPEALPVAEYLRNMRRLLRDCPFEHALCSHRQALYGRETVEAFFSGLTPACLNAARPTDTGAARGIRTGLCEPAPGQELVFDLDKYQGESTDEGI